MTTYIAQFTAKHRIVQIEQNSVLTWRQDGDEIDVQLLEDKIKRESSIHFFQLVVGKNYKIVLEDISVTVWKTQAFSG